MLHMFRKAATPALLLLALPLVGCQQKVDKGKAEAAVKKYLGDNGVKKGTVSCPDGQMNKEGNSFDCSVTDDRGNKSKVKVSITKGGNGSELNLEARVLHLKKFGESQKESCPDETVFVVAGAAFTCEAQAGGAKLTIGFKIDDKNNLVRDHSTDKIPPGATAAATPEDPDEATSEDTPKSATAE